MELSGKLFFHEAKKIIERLEVEQMPNIKKAAEIMAKSIVDNGVVHVFGAGHSKAFVMELHHRAGGLAAINGMSLDDLAHKGDNPSPYKEVRCPETERSPKNGLKVMNLHNIQASDVMIICSNSGRNGAVVEMALETKRRSLPLIAVTSIAHSSKVTARHPSGKRLFEIADIVIDNCAPYGDALLPLPGTSQKVCGVSSVSNIFIAQALNAETIQNILNMGIKPDILLSQNIDGADEHNEALKIKYKGRVSE